MKIYTLLESNEGLSKIVTYPEYPDSDIQIVFNNCYGENIVSNKYIRRYVQFVIKKEQVDERLAMAIANDYPHLFKEPLEFLPQRTIKDPPCPLSEDLKNIAENRLKKLDNQLVKTPKVLKLKINRADTLNALGKYQLAKLEYEDLLICAGSNPFKSRIQNGIRVCDTEIKRYNPIFQTPFSLAKDTGKHNSRAFFFSSSFAIKKEQIESIPLTENLFLVFKDLDNNHCLIKDGLSVVSSLWVNGVEVKNTGMFMEQGYKEQCVALSLEPLKLIALLEESGETAHYNAEIIQRHLVEATTSVSSSDIEQEINLATVSFSIPRL